MKSYERLLLIAGVCSLAVAILHIAIIIGGPEWYRFFGAGEEMALMSESGSFYPTMLTSVIVLIFIIWGIYAFSGAGLIRKIPLLRFALVVISITYLIRGLGGIPPLIFPNYPFFVEFSNQKTSMLVTSLISLLFGLFYTIGTIKSWSSISNKST
jgi:putative oxidoreductase